MKASDGKGFMFLSAYQRYMVLNMYMGILDGSTRMLFLSAYQRYMVLNVSVDSRRLTESVSIRLSAVHGSEPYPKFGGPDKHQHGNVTHWGLHKLSHGPIFSLPFAFFLINHVHTSDTSETTTVTPTALPVQRRLSP